MASPDDQPLEVLRHDPVPGYPGIFWAAFLVMGFYLLFILVSSPGPAGGHKEKHEGGGKAEAKAEPAVPAQPSPAAP